jgi:N-acetylglutamate synthase-like GNAT family acetyltransferase
MASAAESGFAIAWHQGPREELRDLFALAEDSAAQLESYLHRGRVLVARTDAGEIAGHVQLIRAQDGGVVEINSLAVHGRFRRRGVGRSLVTSAVDACRSEHARVVTVATAMADVDTLRFYQRCGFRAVSVERDAFTPDNGYAAGLTVGGIPLRDGIRFALELATPGSSGDPRRAPARTSGCDSAAAKPPLRDGHHTGGASIRRRTTW